jgi:MerR family transcriptional regulator, light-induced transcriptional regulator
MRDSQDGGPLGRSADGLSVLARTVVARLAARTGAVRVGRGPRQIDDDMVQALARAVASADPFAFEALRPDLRRARIGDIDLVDSYFPAVARHLGCGWAEDRIGWAEVTIGVARMQSLVHQIGLDWDGSTAPDADSVLVVLPEGEQHSFGVQVMAGQLRRQGVSVHLQIGPRPAALRSLVQERHYDCALISVGSEDRIDACRKLVKTLKDGSEGRLWVAVGGAVLDLGRDILGLTGADMATNDPAEVLTGANDAATAARRGHHDLAWAEATGHRLAGQ